MNIEIKIDTSAAEKMLAGLPDAIARARKRALTDIGAAVKNRAELTFRNPQFRPLPWAKRKNNADPERPLLYKSGVMRRDLKSRLEGDDTVVIGTPHEYLKYHQFGTQHMPPRPVLPLDRYGNLLPDMRRKIKDIVDKDTLEELAML